MIFPRYQPLKKQKFSHQKRIFTLWIFLAFAIILFACEDMSAMKKYRTLTLRQKFRQLTLGQKHEKYFMMHYVPEHKELPFCIITQSKREIIQSIQNQNYSNFKIVEAGRANKLSFYRQLVALRCNQTDIVIFATQKIKKNGLHYLNNLYQRYSIFLMYKKNNAYSVISFYASVFDKFESNKIKRSPNTRIINEEMNYAILALMEMSKYHMMRPEWNQVFEGDIQSSFLTTDPIEELVQSDSTVQAYSPMYSLSESFYIQIKRRQIAYQKFLNDEKAWKRRQANLTQDQVLMAIEYRSLLSLPINHSLVEREKAIYDQKYEISKYAESTRLCVVILSHDNVENRRYEKVLDSIKIQDYDNYHIVFIDDFSSDNTLSATKAYAEKISLIKKMNFIRNEEQKYATYNMKNAAYNYCKADQIFTIVDGDDQLVGKQVFKLVNAFYQKKNNWIVYTNFFSSEYTYGKSKPLKEEYFNYKERYNFHIIGPLRTFRVDLYRKIKEKDHKNDYGQYLDTLYDDGMQFPMMEMAGMDRISYINQVCYFYNTWYRGNDDSTVDKRIHRWQIFKQILAREKYDLLDNLD